MDILIPLIGISVAEWGEKTQISILLLSSKVKKHFYLLLGVMLAYLIVDGVVILAGECSKDVVPTGIMKILSGVIFIVFGILIWRRKKEEGKKRDYFIRNPFYSGFFLIFLSEWGDKTQIASGIFATKYNGLMVLLGVMIALTLLSGLTIYLGKFISGKFKRERVTKIAGILFILIGVTFLF